MMFTTKTLFVLGAVLSKEAKMPEGSELLVNIAQLLNFSYDTRFDRELGSAKIQDAIAIYMQELSNGAQTNANPYLQAAKDIHDMAPMSDTIDGVLDRHQDNEHINLCGKLAISEAILIAEKNSYLSKVWIMVC